MPQARVVCIRGSGGPEVLALEAREVRTPGRGEVLVEVAAAGLNRADLLQRQGLYPAPPGVPADVPGLELSGVVAAVGPGVDEWRVGDAVMGIVGGGAMATHVLAPARELLPVPKGMELIEAAAIPEVFTTAYDGLFHQGGLVPGETVVLHAVASGVGTAALQLAKAVSARVVGTSRTGDKLRRLEELALRPDHAVVPDEGRFASAVEEAVGPVPLIFDPVGASYLEENLALLAPRGRLVIYGLMGGRRGEIALGEVLRKRLTITGTVLRSRTPEEKAVLARAMHQQVIPMFERGAVRPVIDTVLPMEDVAEAHRMMASNQNLGKVLLRW